MLRITSDRREQATLFILEGSLSGVWVQEFERVWKAEIPPKKEVWVDLCEVTFVDDVGKELLARIHGEGARFRTSRCLAKSIIEEITRASHRRQATEQTD